MASAYKALLAAGASESAAAAIATKHPNAKEAVARFQGGSAPKPKNKVHTAKGRKAAAARKTKK